MRRIGLWIALVALLIAAWMLARAIEVGRRAPGVAASPTSPQTHRGEVEHMDGVAHRLEAASSEPASPRLAEEDPADEGVRLCVVDPADAPIAGARVRVVTPAGVPLQVTDALGQCLLPFAPPKEGWSVVVEADGRFPVQAYRFGVSTDCILLHPAGRLAGRVLESGSRIPIPGALVWAPWKHADEAPVGITTDAAGRFADVEIPLDKGFYLAVRASGFLDTERFEDTHIVKADDPDPVVEVLLERARVGELLVVDSESGEPVAKAEVRSWRAEYSTDQAGRASVDRSFRLSDATHGVTVDAQGYCLTTFELHEVGTVSEPVEVRLTPACSITGLLLDARGAPIDGVEVIARVTPEAYDELLRTRGRSASQDAFSLASSARWVRSSSSDRLSASDAGRFEVGRFPPGLTAVELSIEKDGGTLAHRRVGPLGPPGTRLHVDWQLAQPGSGGLRGRLLLNGEPHPGSVTWKQDGREDRVEVGADGEFAFDGIEPGPVDLYGNLSGGTGRWGVHGAVSARVDVVADSIARCDLDCLIATNWIRGSVSDSSGAPQAGIEVRFVRRDDHSSFQGTSDTDGAWSVRVADVAETYTLVCDRPLLEEGRGVRAGTEGLALHLLSSGRLRFRALDASTGEILSGVMVSRLLYGHESRTVAFPARDAKEKTGWTEVDVPEGNQELGAWTLDGAYRMDRRSVQVVTGSVSEVEFRLEPASIATLRLDPAGGSLPAGHIVLLLAEDEWPLVTAELGKRGPQVSFAALPNDPTRPGELWLRPGQQIKVSRLAPGRYRFKVFPDDVRLEPEWIDVPSEGVVDVRWSFKP